MIVKRPKLRLLFVSFNMPWRGGGTFYRVMGFARELVNRGHQVTILATSVHGKWRFIEEEVDGVKLALAPAWLTGKLRTGWDPFEVLRRCAWLRGRRFDLIHGFESRPVVIFPSLYGQWKYSVPLVLDWCDWFGRGGSVEERQGVVKWLLRPVETFFEERFRHLAQGATVINQPLKERAMHLGVSEERIHWLPNGANLEGAKMLDPLEIRRDLGLDPHAIYIGHLGQAFVGDARLMAAAFARVRQAYPMSRLLLVGNHKTDIVQFVDSPSSVIETGYVTDEQLRQYLSACDLLWLPLRDTLANRGRFPMKVNDYMASGRAVVGTDVGDMAALFQAPRSIGLMAADNPEDFAGKTISLLRDREARTQYGRNGRFRVETEFAWPLVTEQLEHFYYQVLKKS